MACSIILISGKCTVTLTLLFSYLPVYFLDRLSESQETELVGRGIITSVRKTVSI